MASLLFAPHRATRPHAIVVLVRGIPGSGKSWLAQKLRALEIENGGKPPRILSIDPFFMVELEDENTNSRSPSIREKYVHDAAKEGEYPLLIVATQAMYVDAGATAKFLRPKEPDTTYTADTSTSASSPLTVYSSLACFVFLPGMHCSANLLQIVLYLPQVVDIVP